MNREGVSEFTCRGDEETLRDCTGLTMPDSCANQAGVLCCMILESMHHTNYPTFTPAGRDNSTCPTIPVLGDSTCATCNHTCPSLWNTCNQHFIGKSEGSVSNSIETCPACDSDFVTIYINQVASAEKVDASELVPKLQERVTA